MIPKKLPYRKLSRDEIDTENLTWFDYIIGRFSGEMWWERDDIDASWIRPLHWHPIPFPEEPNILHLWFFGRLKENKYRTNIPWFPSGKQSVERLDFFLDTQCRFDIWTLYNHPPQEVDIEAGGSVKIEMLPNQEDVENVLPLRETVPSDVPLIFGPRFNRRSGSSIPHRPFAQNNSQIPNVTNMEAILQEDVQKVVEERKRQRAQFQKWKKAQDQRKKRHCTQCQKENR